MGVPESRLFGVSFFIYMGWRVLYIEESTELHLYLDNIKIIYNNNNPVVLALSDIHTLIIDNPKLSITTQLLNKCCEYNVNVIMCSIDHMPNVVVSPFSGNRLAPLLLRKQLAWDDASKAFVHKLIIQNKIRNQRRLLEYFKLSEVVIERLISYENEVEIKDTTNREGLAAKSYFRELFGPKFLRFNDDTINAGLNYGYSILRSQISKTLIAKGLNPTFGIIHYGPENAFNLSDDIIEPFRPIVDAYCFKNLKDTFIFKKENKLALIEASTISIEYGGVNQTLFNALSMYIESIILFFETGDYTKILDIRIPYEEI